MSELKEGIYLQEKQGCLGSGTTSQEIVYENYYAVRIAGQDAEMFLLDEELTLTGLRERVPLGKLAESYRYQPLLHARFQELNASLGPLPKAPPPPPTALEAASAPASAPAPASTAPPAAAPKPKAKAEPQAGWWDMTRRGAENLVKKA